jgi:hypothetical protein
LRCGSWGRWSAGSNARRLATSAGLFRIVKDHPAFAGQLSPIRPQLTRTVAIGPAVFIYRRHALRLPLQLLARHLHKLLYVRIAVLHLGPRIVGPYAGGFFGLAADFLEPGRNSRLGLFVFRKINPSPK